MKHMPNPKQAQKAGIFCPFCLHFFHIFTRLRRLRRHAVTVYPCKFTKKHEWTNVVTCLAHFVQNDARKASSHAGSGKVVTKCTKWTQKARPFSLVLFIHFGAYISTILRNSIHTRRNLDRKEKGHKRGWRSRGQHSWQPPPLMQCSAQRADARDRNEMAQNHFCKWFYFYF